jgi:hypothetical protein
MRPISVTFSGRCSAGAGAGTDLTGGVGARGRFDSVRGFCDVAAGGGCSDGGGCSAAGGAGLAFGDEPDALITGALACIGSLAGAATREGGRGGAGRLRFGPGGEEGGRARIGGGGGKLWRAPSSPSSSSASARSASSTGSASRGALGAREGGADGGIDPRGRGGWGFFDWFASTAKPQSATVLAR